MPNGDPHLRDKSSRGNASQFFIAGELLSVRSPEWTTLIKRPAKKSINACLGDASATGKKIRSTPARTPGEGLAARTSKYIRRSLASARVHVRRLFSRANLGRCRCKSARQKRWRLMKSRSVRGHFRQ